MFKLTKLALAFFLSSSCAYAAEVVQVQENIFDNTTIANACGKLKSFEDMLGEAGSCSVVNSKKEEEEGSIRMENHRPTQSINFGLYLGFCVAFCNEDCWEYFWRRRLVAPKTKTATEVSYKTQEESEMKNNPEEDKELPISLSGDCKGFEETFVFLAENADMISANCLSNNDNADSEISAQILDSQTICNDICFGAYVDMCWWRRALRTDLESHLKNVNEMPKERVLAEMKRFGSNPNGIYSKKTNGLPEESCKKAIEFLNTKEDYDFVHAGTPERNNIVISGEDLISIIGKAETKSLVDFFHESVGYKAPITGIRMQRHDNKEEIALFNGHIDRVNTMIVFLKQNYDNDELNGGGIYHFTGDGLIKTEKITAGTTILQGPDVLHETYPWTGVRDLIDISSDPMIKDAKCMLSHLLE